MCGTHENAVCGAVRHHVAAHVQTSRASRAVVVHVVDGDLGHAELVEHTLAAGGVAIAVASDTLVNIVVVDLGIEHSLDTSLETELSVVDLAAGLDELGHAHAEHVAWLRCLLVDHFGGVLVVCREERCV